jgi:hypothetical protein
MVAQILQYA